MYLLLTTFKSYDEYPNFSNDTSTDRTHVID